MKSIIAAAALAAASALPPGASASPGVTLDMPADVAALQQAQVDEGHYHEGEAGEKLLYLEQRLKCNCGCGLDVHSCQFQMQCGTSPVWSARIRRELEQGIDVETIEAGFVAEFGPTVLMAPPPEGFNLVGYLLPAIAIVTAGVLVGLVVRSGRGREPDTVPASEISDEEMARIEEEMRKLDEAESPDW